MRRKYRNRNPFIKRIKAAIMRQLVPENVEQQFLVVLPLRQDDHRREHAEHQGRPERTGADEFGFAPGNGGVERAGKAVGPVQRTPQAQGKPDIGEHRRAEAQRGAERPDRKPEYRRAPGDRKGSPFCGRRSLQFRCLSGCGGALRLVGEGRQSARGGIPREKNGRLLPVVRSGFAGSRRFGRRRFPDVKDQAREGQSKAKQHQQPCVVIHRAWHLPQNIIAQAEKKQSKNTAAESQRQQGIHHLFLHLKHLSQFVQVFLCQPVRIHQRRNQIPRAAVIKPRYQVFRCPCAVFFFSDQRGIVVDIPLFLADNAF